MVGQAKDQHQPEPWDYECRSIRNASGWTLAKTIFEADARRIVAAVNDVLGIPTAALEAGFIREILVPRPESTTDFTIRIHPLPQLPFDPADVFIHDRRVGERRKAERRRGVTAGPRILRVNE